MRIMQNAIKTISTRTFTGYVVSLAIIVVLFNVTFCDVLTSYPISLPFDTKFKLRYFDDVFVVFLYLLMIWDFIKTGYVSNQVKNPVILIGLIMIWSIFSTICIGRSLITNNSIFLARDSFWYFPVFYFVVKYYGAWGRVYERYALLFIDIQLTALILAEVYHIGTEGSILYDVNINGTLGGSTSHVLSYCLLLFQPLLFKKKKYIRMGLCTLFFTLASARSAWVFLFFFSALFILFKADFKRKILYLLLIVAVFFPAYYVYNNYTHMRLNPSKLYKYQVVSLENEYSGAARVSFFLYSMQKLRNAQDVLMGRGIGTYASRTAKKIGGDFYKEYERDFPFANGFVTGGSTLNYWLVEYGAITSIMLFVLFGYFLWIIRKDQFVLLVFIVNLAGLIPQKLMESYGVGFFWFFMLGIYSARIVFQQSTGRTEELYDAPKIFTMKPAETGK
jgi:hypothetical protein